MNEVPSLPIRSRPEYPCANRTGEAPTQPVRTGAALVAALLVMSGCSMFRSSGDCDDATCEPGPTVRSASARQSWYCYGVPESREWDCSKSPDPARIRVVVPGGPGEQAVTRDRAMPVTDDDDEGARAADVRMPAPEPAPVTARETDDDPEAKAAPVAVAPATPPRPVMAPAASPVRERILATPPDYFAVQLMAMRDRDAVVRYATSQGLEDPIVVEIIQNGVRWHLLLLGTYANKDDAERAREDWESHAKVTAKPWIRRLAPLQQAMRTSGEA